MISATAFVEKTPLERYVAPDKPSLVGLTRAQLAALLGRDRRAARPAQDARAAALALDLFPRADCVRRHDQHLEGNARGARASISRWRGPRWWPSRSRSTARANGCCVCPARQQGERPHEVECVYIPDTDRGTLCVSSQVGCTLNCSFCHTGTQRLVRNLTAGEIVGQVMMARDRLGDWPGAVRPSDGVIPTGDRCITNIVMMGMGEPLYNFDAVRDALLIVADGEGIAISKRRITLSTSGVVPNIERAGAEIGCMLAVSLHAVRDELRNELVPLNRKYPIARIAGGLPQLSRRSPTPSASPSNT